MENRNPFVREIAGDTLAARFENNLRDNNVVSQRGLVEMFDSTIGASTVLMPFGGRTQGSETQVSVQKLPTDGYTDTASIMAFGYNPFIASWSPLPRRGLCRGGGRGEGRGGGCALRQDALLVSGSISSA